MPDHDYRPEGDSSGNSDGDDLDRALDAALTKYAAVEPRVGMEERVLANLRAQRAQDSVRGWWPRRLVFALAAAVVVVSLLLVFRSAHQQQVNLHRIPPPVTQQDWVHDGTEASVRPSAVKKRRTPAPRHLSAVAATEPRLEQFPSPQPLSEQEEILKSYVVRYPEHAALIAEARTEALRQDAADEAAFGSTTKEKDSQQ
jgi:hypothetical protein